MKLQSEKYAELLKSSFDPYFQAPLAAWIEFAEMCEPVEFAKDQVIKQEDSAENFFYYIIKGSAGLFLWKENNFVCLDFAFGNSFCCDYMSLLTQNRTPLQVVALENSTMLRLSKKDFYELGKKPIGNVILRISAESSFVDKQQQQIDLLTRTAKDRYIQLLQKFPQIQQRVAQKHIASYLGITPQSLSRLRREIR